MTRRRASLPMYDADRAAVQRWWAALAISMRREGLRDVPDEIDWPADLDDAWRDPQLLLSQTCGYPLVTRLRDTVQVIGVFRYDAPGCEGIGYRSHLIVRSDDPRETLADYRDGMAAINDPASHSGCNALRGLVAPLARGGRFFGSWVVSGAHRLSIEKVRDTSADIAAIDCVTLAGWLRQDAHVLDGLRILDSTPLAPGLPLVTAASTSLEDLQRLRKALAAACHEASWAPWRHALFIDGFAPAEARVWQPIADTRHRAGLLLEPPDGTPAAHAGAPAAPR